MAKQNPHHDDHHHDDDGHDHSLKPHLLVLGALIFLTGLTYVTATFIHLPGPGNDLLAISIAFTKALLVIGIFMHVREATPLVKLTAISGFFWVFLFFAYLVVDVKTREGQTWYEGWMESPRKVTAPAEPH